MYLRSIAYRAKIPVRASTIKISTRKNWRISDCASCFRLLYYTISRKLRPNFYKYFWDVRIHQITNAMELPGLELLLDQESIHRVFGAQPSISIFKCDVSASLMHDRGSVRADLILWESDPRALSGITTCAQDLALPRMLMGDVHRLSTAHEVSWLSN